MIRKLYAKVFNKSLVFISFGYDHELRLVWYDADGNGYVRLYGSTERLDKTGRDVIWVRRRK